jgi:hypothetical protein
VNERPRAAAAVAAALAPAIGELGRLLVGAPPRRR